MTESVQKWLERNRPPRVKITYEVHTGGALEKRELPFIVGVLADLSGDRSVPQKAPPPLKQRSMVPIDRDTFNDVMAKMAPDVDLTKVADTLSTPAANPSGKLKRSLPFNSIDDFEPLAVVKAIPLLARQYDIRSFIRQLQSRAEASDALGLALDAMLQSSDAAKLQREALGLLNAPAAADRANLPAHRMELWRLAALAAQKPDADLQKPAADWGLMPAAPKVDAAATAEVKAQQTKDLAKFTSDAPQLARAGLERFLRLFSTPDTPESLRQAQQTLTAWATPTPGATLEDLKSRLGAVAAATGDTDAKALVVVLAAGPSDDPVRSLAYQRASLSSRVLSGLLAADDEDAPGLVGETTSDRRATELRHDATNRRFASHFLQNLQKAKSTTPADPKTAGGVAIINQLIDAALPVPDDEPLGLLGALGYFAAEVLTPLEPKLATSKPLRVASAIDLRVQAIDEALGLQLNAVMHSDAFRTLEATWRGLHYLVSRTETGPMLKLQVFNATQAELLDDMERAVDKDQSRLFKLIYEAEYGTFGGLPFSLLVGGYDIGRSPQDIEFLSKMAEIAASAHAPFITAASPALFGLSSFRDLDRPRDLSKIFESADTAAWREFRETEDSRFVSLVLPHALLRLPYGGQHGTPVRGLVYAEDVGTAEPNADRFLWGNAAYLLAERITHAFSLYNWTAAIRGVEGGGLVEGLPIYTYAAANGAQALFCPTEVSITDRREKELNDLGFISLCHCKGKGQAAFFGGQTTNLPKKYITDEANANALISARLPYMLAASRFAHYIKVIMREKVGSFLTRANVESLLNTWIAQYVLLDENAMQEAKATFPLSQARIVVTDVPGQPGAYKAVVFLRPHFQLEELTTSIRLVADLPKT